MLEAEAIFFDSVFPETYIHYTSHDVYTLQWQHSIHSNQIIFSKRIF
jgi:hypothetical protein